jgi:hypothetical protein
MSIISDQAEFMAHVWRKIRRGGLDSIEDPEGVDYVANQILESTIEAALKIKELEKQVADLQREKLHVFKCFSAANAALKFHPDGTCLKVWRKR